MYIRLRQKDSEALDRRQSIIGEEIKKYGECTGKSVVPSGWKLQHPFSARIIIEDVCPLLSEMQDGVISILNIVEDTIIGIVFKPDGAPYLEMCECGRMRPEDIFVNSDEEMNAILTGLRAI